VADADAVAALVAELRGSRKYGTLDADALARTSTWALDRSRTRKEAAKAARRKLHQVYGAYLPASGIADAESAARALGHGELETVCRSVLAAHASTRERLDVMPEFFAAAFGPLTGAMRVADIGAGLNAFAIPWMALDPQAAYLSVDVDERMAHLVERLAPHVGVDLIARTEDLVSSLEPLAADVALLLKVIPALEQQAPGAGARLLERIDARRLVITVSAHSLGGRKKGMREHHMAMLNRLIPELSERQILRYDFPSETMLILDGTPQRT
jgi:16S rRNA (guanine(1405)-N(7))-methyltransferase